MCLNLLGFNFNNNLILNVDSEKSSPTSDTPDKGVYFWVFVMKKTAQKPSFETSVYKAIMF
jgi:hypothetical protein